MQERMRDYPSADDPKVTDLKASVGLLENSEKPVDENSEFEELGPDPYALLNIRHNLPIAVANSTLQRCSTHQLVDNGGGRAPRAELAEKIGTDTDTGEEALCRTLPRRCSAGKGA
jgi:hypothetical protein